MVTYSLLHTCERLRPRAGTALSSRAWRAPGGPPGKAPLPGPLCSELSTPPALGRVLRSQGSLAEDGGRRPQAGTPKRGNAPAAELIYIGSVQAADLRVTPAWGVSVGSTRCSTGGSPDPEVSCSCRRSGGCRGAAPRSQREPAAWSAAPGRLGSGADSRAIFQDGLAPPPFVSGSGASGWLPGVARGGTPCCLLTFILSSPAVLPASSRQGAALCQPPQGGAQVADPPVAVWGHAGKQGQAAGPLPPSAGTQMGSVLWVQVAAAQPEPRPAALRQPHRPLCLPTRPVQATREPGARSGKRQRETPVLPDRWPSGKRSGHGRAVFPGVRPHSQGSGGSVTPGVDDPGGADGPSL